MAKSIIKGFSNKYLANSVALLSVILVALLWTLETVVPDNLDYSVPTLTKQRMFETPYLYYMVHAFSLIPVFLLSFDKRVHFYKKWKYLFPAIGIVGFVFIVWDILFTKAGVWGFNTNYYLEATHLLGLPLEEWLFFFSVPYACVFIYECLKCYQVPDYWQHYDRWISYGLVGLLLGVAALNLEKSYTAITCVLTAAYIWWHFLSQENNFRTRVYFAYLIIIIPFLIVDGVLTGVASNAPIVLYNPEEFLGLRIISIPIEDGIYGFLMVFAIIDLFEWFRS